MRPWIFIQNPFLNATESSYLNAMGISTYHDSALAKVVSDAFFAALYASFHPLHLAYKTAYDSWVAQGGEQQSDTLTVEQLLRLLFAKIGQWDIKIQNQYPINTAGYKRLLPNRRKPFQRGGQIERIAAVKALSQNIGDDTSLAAVKTDVDNFEAQINEALKTQKGSISATKNMSTELEAARVAMCTGMYANLGALIQKYAATSDRIEHFFDLQAIRNMQQISFTGSLKAGEVYSIVKHTFGADDELWLSNSGNAMLKFYLSNTRNGSPDGTFVTLPKGEIVVKASELGKLTDTYLTVQNADALLNGEFEAEML